jgi:ABC-type nitrate/sulfonate/bicarbonate transport system ATPase subunit
MEGIIRPFQTVNNTPKPVVGGVFQQVSKNSVLAFGKSGGGKSATLNLSAAITSYMTKRQKEVKK